MNGQTTQLLYSLSPETMGRILHVISSKDDPLVRIRPLLHSSNHIVGIDAHLRILVGNLLASVVVVRVEEDADLREVLQIFLLERLLPITSQIHYLQEICCSQCVPPCILPHFWHR